MQIAYRARDLIEANLVAGLIQAHDIDCHVGGNYLQGGMGEIGTSGFTNVHVEDEDFERARQLVAEYEQDLHRDTTDPDPAPVPAESSRVNHLARVFLIACAMMASVLWIFSAMR
ncbi:MAG: DUF2007 domain-containing protein [Oleiphilaceae bacterium]|nr:DUF2007 domain-containing protein [Oleiphilaceae bacterium]